MILREHVHDMMLAGGRRIVAACETDDCWSRLHASVNIVGPQGLR